MFNSKNKLILSIIFVILIIVGLIVYLKKSVSNEYVPANNNNTYIPIPPNDSVSTSTPQISLSAKCIGNGGAWTEAYKECTGISENICKQIGGAFNECASACRHNPNAEVCTMQCVQVCNFK